MILEELVKISNYYGSNPGLVLAGGGNTSAKEDNILYIKGSGNPLSTIKGEGFVKMDRQKLSAIFDKKYPEEDSARERIALEDLMEARLPSESEKRPSVETLLHSLFSGIYVLHLHPAIINGLTCAADGEKTVNELFGDNALWVGLCKPGYILSKICKEKMDIKKAETGRDVDILILQNHGIFISADTASELDGKLNYCIDAIKSRIKNEPDFNASNRNADVENACAEIEKLFGNNCIIAYDNSFETLKISENPAAVMKPFTPDHIVYCKAYPLYAEAIKDIGKNKERYENKNGYDPKIVIIKGIGAFAVSGSEKETQTAMELYKDAVKIAVYTESFGGLLHMTDEMTDFIVNWEVEAYRQSKAVSV